MTGHFCDGVTTVRPPVPTGVEIPGAYDGILFWACTACGQAWHRFGYTHPLHARAVPHVQAWMAQRRRTA